MDEIIKEYTQTHKNFSIKQKETTTGKTNVSVFSSNRERLVSCIQGSTMEGFNNFLILKL